MDVLGTVLVLAVALVCVRLGVWQLERLRERKALNARIVERRQQAPLPALAALADSSSALFRQVRLSGRYDVERSIVLPGRSLRGAPGVHLLTPFLAGNDTAVLVNRGWVPAADGATIPVDSFPVQAADIEGLVQPFPVGGTGGRPVAADTFRTTWYAPDLAAMRAQFPYLLLPVTVQLLPSTDAPAYPRRLEPPALDQGPHLGYAIQWFSFATIAVVGWIALSRRGRRTRTAPEPAP